MSTAPAIDEREHAEVVKSALAAVNVSAFDYDETDDLPRKYALVSIERRYVEPMRGGHSGRSGWRVALRLVGTTVDEVRWMAARSAVALDGQRLTIGGHDSTPVVHESSQAAELDDGMYSGLAVYVYAL